MPIIDALNRWFGKPEWRWANAKCAKTIRTMSVDDFVTGGKFESKTKPKRAQLARMLGPCGPDARLFTPKGVE